MAEETPKPHHEAHHQPAHHQAVAAPLPVAPPIAAPAKQPDSPLAIISMILGIVSFMGPGLLFGIPAIVLGAIAIKKKQPNHGLSVTGIVTGAISTFFSLVLFGFIVWAIVYAANHPEEYRDSPRTMPDRPLFDSSRT